jgi:hypothetical protein
MASCAAGEQPPGWPRLASARAPRPSLRPATTDCITHAGIAQPQCPTAVDRRSSLNTCASMHILDTRPQHATMPPLSPAPRGLDAAQETSVIRNIARYAHSQAIEADEMEIDQVGPWG